MAEVTIHEQLTKKPLVMQLRRMTPESEACLSHSVTLDPSSRLSVLPGTEIRTTRSRRHLFPRSAFRPAALLGVPTCRRRLGAARSSSGVRCQNATDVRSALGTLQFAHSGSVSPMRLRSSRSPSGVVGRGGHGVKMESIKAIEPKDSALHLDSGAEPYTRAEAALRSSATNTASGLSSALLAR